MAFPIRTLLLWYLTLAVAFFAYLYTPLLAVNQVLDDDKVYQYFMETTLPIDKKRLNNRHIVSIVTGSTNGIGREIATVLYSLGLTVIMASRNPAKCAKVMDEIRTEFPSSRGELISGQIDTGDLASVAEFARTFAEKKLPLHLLVLNAGIHYVSLEIDGKNAMNPKVPAISPQNYDLAFATNYLGHFFLAKLLQPIMLTSNAGGSDGTRILSVASTYHMQSDGTMLLPSSPSGMPLAARADVNTLHHRMASYSNNKLAQVLHARELQRRLDEEKPASGGGLKVVSFCPGWVDTGMLPQNAGANMVRSLAFSSRAATIGALGGLFSKKIKGGEFISNYNNFFTSQLWSEDFFRLLTKFGVRDVVSHALAMVVLLTQGASYGFKINKSSPESYDATLAKALFDWSDAEVTKPAFCEGSK